MSDEYDETEGRWGRIYRGGPRRWVVPIALVLVLLPILLAAGVVLLNGRPLALGLVRWLTAKKFPRIEWVDGDELAEWRSDSTRAQPVLLDARTAPEYAVSHLKGAQRIDPRQPSLKPLEAFPRDTPIVVYCSVGYRSARVANFLSRHGFHKVYDLAGSIFGWANDGGPLEANGRPAKDVHPYNDLWGKLLKPAVRADVPPVTDPLSLP